jgi:sortase A
VARVRSAPSRWDRHNVGVSRSFPEDEESPIPQQTGTVPPRRPASRSRVRRSRVSAFTVAGLVMLVAGLGCLGWVGYQYFGTGIASKRAFQQEKEGLRTQWLAPSAGASTPPTGRDEVVIPGDAFGLLRIPAFGAEYEVPILSGTEPSILSRGVGHYPSTAMPGQVGNFALAGHRVTHGEPFARLLELKQGDQVIIETRDSIYTYVLDVPPKEMTVKDTETCVIKPVPCTDAEPTEPMLTLTTCEDLFRSADRSVGYAHLRGTENKN